MRKSKKKLYVSFQEEGRHIKKINIDHKRAERKVCQEVD